VLTSEKLRLPEVKMNRLPLGPLEGRFGLHKLLEVLSPTLLLDVLLPSVSSVLASVRAYSGTWSMALRKVMSREVV
jgi:hypothetical protein